MIGTQQKVWLEQVISVYLQYRQFAKAQPLLLLLAEFYPEELKPMKQLAYLYYQQKKYAEVLGCCERYHAAKAQDKDKATMFLLESFCHLKLDQSLKAQSCYQQFSEERLIS